MDVLYPRCAGLDVHKATVVACIRLVSGGAVQRAVRTFPTTTAGLLELADWLRGAGCTHAAMESTGVYWKTRLRKGAPWLKTVLVQCAWAATRAQGTYLQAQFRRLKSRRDAMKAVGAVAASILTAVYHMLRDGVPYRDLGPDHFTRVDKARLARRLAARLTALGYDVQLHAPAA